MTEWSLPGWGPPSCPRGAGPPRAGGWGGAGCPIPAQRLPRRVGMDGVGDLGSLFSQLRQCRDACSAPELQESQEGAMRRPSHRGAEMSPLALPRYLPSGTWEPPPRCPPPRAVWPHRRPWPWGLSAVPPPQPALSARCRAPSSPPPARRCQMPASTWRVAHRCCWPAAMPTGASPRRGCARAPLPTSAPTGRASPRDWHPSSPMAPAWRWRT